MSKSKSRRKVVKGPQLASRVLLGKARKAKASEPERHAYVVAQRTRFVERPSKPDGNPFFAVRVRRELLAAFKKHAAGRKVEATALVRAYMAKVTGVSAEADNDDE